MYVCVIV